jgi:hypothetical protein
VATLSERGRDALVRRQKAAAGVSVTITRGAETITVTAIPGATVYDSLVNGGPRTEISTRDYLVAVEDYVFGGAATTPAIGDRFAETVNGAVLVTECQNPKNGEQAWRYSSQWRALYRIHCHKAKAS